MFQNILRKFFLGFILLICIFNLQSQAQFSGVEYSDSLEVSDIYSFQVFDMARSGFSINNELIERNILEGSIFHLQVAKDVTESRPLTRSAESYYFNVIIDGKSRDFDNLVYFLVRPKYISLSNGSTVDNFLYSAASETTNVLYGQNVIETINGSVFRSFANYTIDDQQYYTVSTRYDIDTGLLLSYEFQHNQGEELRIRRAITPLSIRTLIYKYPARSLLLSITAVIALNLLFNWLWANIEMKLLGKKTPFKVKDMLYPKKEN